MTVVTLYTRGGCHLCDEAHAILLEALQSVSFELEVADIGRDPVLARRYGWDVPVIAINGVDTFQHRLTLDQLLATLQSTP